MLFLFLVDSACALEKMVLTRPNTLDDAAQREARSLVKELLVDVAMPPESPLAANVDGGAMGGEYFGGQRSQQW
jgi:hypothetical protein